MLHLRINYSTVAVARKVLRVSFNAYLRFEEYIHISMPMDRHSSTLSSS